MATTKKSAVAREQERERERRVKIARLRVIADRLLRVDEIKAERNQLIYELCNDGMSERAVGDIIGMSGPGVHHIYWSHPDAE
jgi:hypothetical protein